MFRILTVTVFLMTTGLSLTAAPADLESRRKAMKDLLAEQWEYNLSHNPEFASILGDKRWNDKLSDFSQEEIDNDLAKTKEFLGRFEAIDPTGFPEQEALTRTLLVRGFREQLEDARFKNWEMPVTQIYGIHIDESDVATIDMTLTSAACPLTDVIEDQAKTATDGLVQDLRINWVWMPPWGPDKITDDGREQLRALGFRV